MNRTLEDFIESTQEAHSVEEVCRVFQQRLADLGCSGSAYARFRSGSLERFVWDRQPIDFASTYLDQRWDRVDPALQRAMKSSQPFFWQTRISDQDYTPRQQDYIAELRARRMWHVVMTPLHGPGGALELCGVTANDTGPVPKQRLSLLHALTLQGILRSQELMPSEGAPAAAPSLSKREAECLKWLRDSKSNWEIGQILRISEKTVEFHVGNVIRKLKAENRLSAVLNAIRLGLLEL